MSSLHALCVCEHVYVHAHVCDLGKGSLLNSISKWIIIILITGANVKH